jgi:dATP/dGTP diphosphohydrolase
VAKLPKSSGDPGHYETKDSGERQVYSTGMQRDVSTDKPRFDLLIPKDVPYHAQMLTRFAELMARGAQKYDSRNWEKAATEEELDRFKESQLRHTMQWQCGETDEDHAAAIIYNVLAFESTKYKMESK